MIARAVARDLYDGVAMARFFSTLMLISGVAPVVAPLTGGQILWVTDWRGVFVVLIALVLALTAVVWRRLTETLTPADRHRGGVREALHAMRGLLADRVFTGYVLAGGFTFAALFAYISASPNSDREWGCRAGQRACGVNSPSGPAWLAAERGTGLATYEPLCGPRRQVAPPVRHGGRTDGAVPTR